MRFAASVTPRKVSIATEISKAAISGITFLLMAVLLGPVEYGTYVQFAAVAMSFVPLATAGYSSWVQPLAMKNGAATAASVVFPILILVGLPSATMIIFLTNIMFTGQLGTIAAVVIIEMVIFPLWASLVLVFLTSGHLSHYFVSSIAVPIVKLTGTIAAFTIYEGGLEIWGTVLLPLGLAGIGVTMFVARACNVRHGLRTIAIWLRRGFGFASVGVASSATDAADKLVVSLSGGAAAAGTYGVAARFAAYGVIPVRAIALVSYPRYFHLAETNNLSELRQLMYATIRKSMWLGAISAVVAICGLYLASITVLTEYADSLLAGLVLAMLIPIRGVQYAAGDVTYALGRPQWRLAITVVGGVATAVFVGFGYLVAGTIGSAFGVVGSAVVVAALLLAYVEFWIRKRK